VSQEVSVHKVAGLGLMAAVVLALGVVAPVAAASRTSVHMEVQTNFDPAADPFTANIDGCTEGYVSNGDNTTNFTRFHGLYVGYKVFDCGGGTGFLVRLNANFSYSGGSTGTWAIVDAWGSLAGLQGSGKQTGISTGPDSILDIYDGSIN
jgi:hypothetical protein